MRGFISRIAIASLVIVLSAALATQSVGNVKALDPTWIDATQLYATKIQDIQPGDIPSTMWSGGNLDCTQSGSLCTVLTSYGLGSSNSQVEFLPNDSQYYPVKDYFGRSNLFLPLPNSSTAITYSASSSWGDYIYFYNNFSSTDVNALTDFYGAKYYQINRTFDKRLEDKSGTAQLLDLNSIGLSSNNGWMIANRPNLAVEAVNMSTKDIIPFGAVSVINYGGGQNPAYEEAITGDGHFAAVATKNHSNFAIYDLSTCGTVPNNITGPVSCQYRWMDHGSDEIGQLIPGYTGTQYVRFVDDNNIDIYVSYLDGTTTKYAEYNLSTTN